MPRSAARSGLNTSAATARHVELQALAPPRHQRLLTIVVRHLVACPNIVCRTMMALTRHIRVRMFMRRYDLLFSVALFFGLGAPLARADTHGLYYTVDVNLGSNSYVQGYAYCNSTSDIVLGANAWAAGGSTTMQTETAEPEIASSSAACGVYNPGHSTIYCRAICKQPASGESVADYYQVTNYVSQNAHNSPGAHYVEAACNYGDPVVGGGFGAFGHDYSQATGVSGTGFINMNAYPQPQGYQRK